MADQASADRIFARLIDYFQGSRFEYLALDYAGGSLRLTRAGAARERTFSDARVSAAIIEPTRVLSPSVGVVELPAGRERFAAAGEHVTEGEALFAIRRFRNVVAVSAPATGHVGSTLVSVGDFVEFGQPLTSVSA